MVLHDFECHGCGHVFEEFVRPEVGAALCPRCGGKARKIFLGNMNSRADAPWIADCKIGFDPADSRPAVREYLANPGDRSLLRRAMKVAGIRHMDAGEEKYRAPTVGLTGAQKRELVERMRTRRGEI